VSFNTNPRVDRAEIVVDIGANWEHGATNRATRMWRMSVRLARASVTVDGKTIVEDGRILWSALGR
jgi:hypothetical protein